VRAIAEEVERLVEIALDLKPLRSKVSPGRMDRPGLRDVIVHVFDEAAREYYDLEHLWNAAPAFRPAAIA